MRAETAAARMSAAALMWMLALATAIPNEYCTPGGPKTLEYFTSRWGRPPPAAFDAATAQISISYPSISTAEYRYEGSRLLQGQCTECAYSEEAQQEVFFDGGVRPGHTPMYGPCLDGERSLKMACVQNMLLQPLEFAGEYYYPDQRAADRTLFSSPLFYHAMMETNFSAYVINRGSEDPSG
jgi:hypothetical protein